jgi:hypothetical protein
VAPGIPKELGPNGKPWTATNPPTALVEMLENSSRFGTKTPDISQISWK